MLVGPGGCGKTTLLSVIAGVLHATGGEVEVLGERLASLAGDRLVRFRRKNLGFVFQQFNLLPALTAAENAAVPLLAAGLPRQPSVRRAAACWVGWAWVTGSRRIQRSCQADSSSVSFCTRARPRPAADCV